MDDGLRGIVPARTKTWPTLALAVGALAGVGYAYWKLAVPEHRVEIRSELVMLGDLDGDRRWTAGDLEALDAFLRDPFAASDALAWNVDLNWNGLIDDEDVCVLRALVAARGDPYARGGGAREERVVPATARALPLCLGARVPVCLGARVPASAALGVALSASP